MKNSKRVIAASLAALIGAMQLMNYSFTTFAAETTTTQQVPQKPENEIAGKITAISASSVTISVATMKERTENNGQSNGSMTPPEKPANDSTSTTDSTNTAGTKPEKPNMDNMFTLTGETKTINIASATFDEGHGGNPPKKDGDTTTTTTTETTAAAKTLTYADFAVGDYITIELTDSTSNVAKSVRAFGMGGHGDGGNGNPPEKPQGAPQG